MSTEAPANQILVTSPNHSNYGCLRRNTKAARSIVDEEIAYCRRTWGHAQECSRARLEQWGARFPWIRTRAHKALGTLGLSV